MDISDIKFKWLRFSAGSAVFGTANQHLGFVIGNNMQHGFCVAVCVTSKWDSRDRARINRGDPPETLSWIRSMSDKGSRHFTKDSVVDCAFPVRINHTDLYALIREGDIQFVTPGEDVDEDLIEEVRQGIIASRAVPNIVKKSL